MQLSSGHESSGICMCPKSAKKIEFQSETAFFWKLPVQKWAKLCISRLTRVHGSRIIQNNIVEDRTKILRIFQVWFEKKVRAIETIESANAYFLDDLLIQGIVIYSTKKFWNLKKITRHSFVNIVCFCIFSIFYN